MEMNDFEELAILTEEWWYMMDKLKKAKSTFYDVKAVQYDKIPYDQKVSDPTLKKFLYIDSLERETAEAGLAKHNKWWLVKERIEKMEKPYSEMLEGYYLYHWDIEKISGFMHITPGEGFRLKREAVEQYEKLYSDLPK